MAEDRDQQLTSCQGIRERKQVISGQNVTGQKSTTYSLSSYQRKKTGDQWTECHRTGINNLLYARIKVHSHASHTPLSCALSGICHTSQASMCNLRRMSHVLNSLKIPIYGNFWALRATLVHFADFVTGHGTSCAPCAVCHTPGALCTLIHAYINLTATCLQY